MWGRGTYRVIEECERWGVEPPQCQVVRRTAACVPSGATVALQTWIVEPAGPADSAGLSASNGLSAVTP
jgi:hypothetical protein